MHSITFPTEVEQAIKKRTEQCFAKIETGASDEELLALIEQGVAVDAKLATSAATLLHCAARLGKNVLVDALIEQEADIEAPDSTHYTPLHIAALYGHAETVTVFLEHGANIESENKFAKTPLRDAASENHISTMIALLEHGADTEHSNRNGATALFDNIYMQHLPALGILLKYGANVEARDNDGRTPLNIVGSNTSYATHIIRTLLNKGANIYALPPHCSNSETPLWGACDIRSYKLSYEQFINSGIPPKTAKEVYHLLCVYPLNDPTAPVDQEVHLRQIFSHARWKDQAQAETVIQQLSDSGMNPIWIESLKAVVSNGQLQASVRGSVR